MAHALCTKNAPVKARFQAREAKLRITKLVQSSLAGQKAPRVRPEVSVPLVLAVFNEITDNAGICER